MEVRPQTFDYTVGVKVNDFHTLAYVKFKLQITDFHILFVRHALGHEIHGPGADCNPKKQFSCTWVTCFLKDFMHFL
jgi:hypothetical protein